jgi:F-type H+-transporting ATPase subunit b
MRFSDIRRKPYAVLAAITALCLIFPCGAALAAEGHANGESGGGGITVIPDISVFIQIANFLFLILVLNVILYKPIRGILIQRKNRLDSLREGIDTFQRSAKQKEEAYLAGIKEARAFGIKEKQSLLDAAAQQEKSIIDKIHQQAQAELAQIRERVAGQAAAAKQELLKEVDGFANTISEKILGRVI